jgi:hypothetical protein
MHLATMRVVMPGRTFEDVPLQTGQKIEFRTTVTGLRRLVQRVLIWAGVEVSDPVVFSIELVCVDPAELPGEAEVTDDK